LVIDGELVALDGRGRPDFGMLQQRMHVTKPTAELVARVPVQYVVFDVLRRDHRSLLGLSYQERRGVLTELGLAERGLLISGNFTDTTGDVVMAAVAHQGWRCGREGAIAAGHDVRPTSGTPHDFWHPKRRWAGRHRDQLYRPPDANA
jgi:bifunctional non-homologous end joining protein LigD